MAPRRHFRRHELRLRPRRRHLHVPGPLGRRGRHGPDRQARRRIQGGGALRGQQCPTVGRTSTIATCPPGLPSTRSRQAGQERLGRLTSGLVPYGGWWFALAWRKPARRRKDQALFRRDKSVISRHIKNVFEEGELSRGATVAEFATVQREGDREVTRAVEHFNLDVIISVGYRVMSHRRR